MRTTIDIEDALLAKARRKAAERNTTLTRIVEDALRRYLMPGKQPRKRLADRWVVVAGTRPPAVDVADRGRLYDFMELPGE